MLRALGAIALAASLVAVSATPSRAATSARRHRGLNARVAGTFEMRATVTVAVNVRGERVGEVVHRRWTIAPERCTGNVCQLLTLDRERSDHGYDHLTLHRTGQGRYRGQGAFYVALRCRGSVYPHGSRVPFVITLRVRSLVRIQGIAFARRITATYINRSRTDSTPCQLGPSHDAGRYTGATTVTPPVASFTAAFSPASDTAGFTDTSHSGQGGAQIVADRWSFGDAASGAADTSTLPDPQHQFSAPGSYTVSLTVRDRNGLSSMTTSLVAAP